MKLVAAELCLDCDEIFEVVRSERVGPGLWQACPACGSRSHVAVARWLNRAA